MGVVLSLLAVCFSVHISAARLFFCFNSFNTKLIQHGRLRHLVWSWLAAVVRASRCVCGAALHCYSNTKRVYTHKTNKEGKKAFSSEEDEKWPRRPDFLRPINPQRFSVGWDSVALQDESRQLVLVPACPEIISLLWFTLAAALIPASASIWVLGLA